MAWQNEMTIIVRHLVNDLDSSSYTFTNDSIEEIIELIDEEEIVDSESK